MERALFIEEEVGLIRELFPELPGYVTLIGVKEDIKVLYERVKQYPGWESLYQKDTYREEYWLEIGDLYNLKSGTIEKRVSVKAIPDDIV